MFDLTPDKIRFVLLAVVAMVLCSAVHEWAHAFTAYRLGDDTAARQGRMTLNPIVHIDPIGTILMPAIGAMMGFIFGYAKPVPFTPVRLTRKLAMKTSVLLVALAGPVSNLIMAFVCGGLLRLIPALTSPDIFETSELALMIGSLLFVGIWLNLVLFIFNFLPVYPLDGSKILEGILPHRYHYVLEFLQRNALLVMLFIFFVGIQFLRGPIGALLALVLNVFGLWPYVHPLWPFA